MRSLPTSAQTRRSTCPSTCFEVVESSVKDLTGFPGFTDGEVPPVSDH